jgi:hypothetical protein
MSEPLADRLMRFTPDGSALDRDALLFNAGRASVRPAYGWKLLAAALALCQIVTLVVLWPRPAPTVPPPPLPAPAHVPSESTAPLLSQEETEWLALTRRASVANALEQPVAQGPLVPDDPPLCAAVLPGDLLPD